MKNTCTGWALAALAWAATATAVAAPPSAAMLANACAGCHGTFGCLLYTSPSPRD